MPIFRTFGWVWVRPSPTITCDCAMLVPPLTADAKRRGHPPLPVTPNATRLVPNIAYRTSGDQRGPRGAAECDRVEELFAVERLPHAAGRAVVHRGAEEIRVN